MLRTKLSVLFPQMGPDLIEISGSFAIDFTEQDLNFCVYISVWLLKPYSEKIGFFFEIERRPNGYS